MWLVVLTFMIINDGCYLKQGLPDFNTEIPFSSKQPLVLNSIVLLSLVACFNDMLISKQKKETLLLRPLTFLQIILTN